VKPAEAVAWPGPSRPMGSERAHPAIDDEPAAEGEDALFGRSSHHSISEAAIERKGFEAAARLIDLSRHTAAHPLSRALPILAPSGAMLRH